MRVSLPCSPRIAPIRVPRLALLGLAVPSKPVGDPESLPPDPAQPQPYEPTDPVHAPRPREPDQPAIDPHDPGMPMPRIREPDRAARCWLN